jgi:hypothetical protein
MLDLATDQLIKKASVSVFVRIANLAQTLIL